MFGICNALSDVWRNFKGKCQGFQTFVNKLQILRWYGSDMLYFQCPAQWWAAKNHLYSIIAFFSYISFPNAGLTFFTKKTCRVIIMALFVI